jgi:hypothetical protein
MPTVEQVRNKVLRILASNFQVKVDDEGDVILTHESAAGFVMVREWFSGKEGREIIVQIQAPILWNVKRTPAVYEWVACTGSGYMMGHVRCTNTENASHTNLVFEHNLIGDNLDENELVNAAALVMITANELDDQLMPKFGGTRTID